VFRKKESLVFQKVFAVQSKPEAKVVKKFVQLHSIGHDWIERLPSLRFASL
jgi:hypothetical protein